MLEHKPSGTYYKIENYNQLPPFFINVASSSDVWMFLSSNGAPAAGRQNSGASVFPYESDDRLHLAAYTGPKTLVKVRSSHIWEPFNTGYDNPYAIRRNLYKRVTGDAVMFEEINDTLQLSFAYRWETSAKYGVVRTAEVKNIGNECISFEILDGVENIIPHGIPPSIASNLTCLADAYKACERPDSGNVAVYSLTSSIGDTVEPVEILRANVAWYIGDGKIHLLSSKQISAFAAGEALQDEAHSVGRKGAFLTHQNITLAPGEEKSWLIMLDAKLSQREVISLLQEVSDTNATALRNAVETDIQAGTEELMRIVAVADGLQHTNGGLSDIRHYMNVLYNNMRGGVFLDGYDFDAELFAGFIAMRNKPLATRRADFISKLHTEKISRITDLHSLAFADGDSDLIRLSLEFLPLTFSRRHGDPSRPWNYFNIQVKDDNGNRIYNYEGNWRDIFQNWEALGLSFPGYIAPIIAKFLNASTADGYNPYRINAEGIDWETPMPHDPWAGIGYWGDHQIVYLNKLMEWLEAYSPSTLAQLTAHEIFTYADVPYEILPYENLVKNGKHTIKFDHARHGTLVEHAKIYGSDGKLIAKGNDVYHVSFMEKLLVPVLAKLSNLVIGGGIWMNTQRPEWNDANNAIVGNGLSMVTVYQLYRHLGHCAKLAAHADVSISAEVKAWLDDIAGAIAKRAELSPRAFLDNVGEAFSRYRTNLYANGFTGGKETLKANELTTFFETAQQTLAETIDANKRPDGMYHSYNILTLTNGGLEISPMFLMLEGQSAILGSGKLNHTEALELVQKMEASDLMNPLLGQFFLYPIKRLNTFVDRNIIPDEYVQKLALIKYLLDSGHDGFVYRDGAGNVRFHHSIGQSSDVENALAKLNAGTTDAGLIREIYEIVFAHKQFTGRSGIMYKYEGIGCIYWHQNSKFMLGLQEVLTQGATEGDIAKLKDAYYRLQDGFGFRKTPEVWGAFPLEPYSHTPYNMPAQQPGMTGQVKEDILTRFAELGVTVDGGILSFNPALLRKEEFLQEPSTFRYVDVHGEFKEIELTAGSLAFTICQVPVVYTVGENDKNTTLDAATSKAIFDRTGTVQRIDVGFNCAKI